MNFPDRITLVLRVHDGKDDLGRDVWREETSSAYGLVALISSKEGTDGAFLITDASIRVPPGYPVLPSASRIDVLTGPLAGLYEIGQVRPSRHHVRYIATRVTGSS